MPLSKIKCDDCGLFGGPRVLGHGKQRPRIMLIGEAPGAQEARQGRPFVGPAGELIRRVLTSIGVDPRDCYFTNACLCRPEGNRTPAASEVTACNERLLAEIEQVSPEYIVTLGATPARAVFQGFRGLKVNRGKLRETKTGHMGIITYHPAACFYSGGDTLLPFIVRDIEKITRQYTGYESPYPNMETTHTVLTTRAAIQDFRNYVLSKKDPVLSFDWETTGVNPRRDKGFCLGMTADVGIAAVVPVSVVWDNRELLNDLFMNCRTIGFNTIFDALFNRYNGLIDRIDEDVMQMHAQLDERPQERSLENLAMEYCDAPPYESEMLARYRCKKSEMVKKVPSGIVYQYCAMDVDYTLRLWYLFKEELSQSLPKQEKHYRKMIVPALRAFRDISDTGIWVDMPRLRETEEKCRSAITQELGFMRQYIGEDKFNPNSHPQVHAALWDKLLFKEPSLYKRKPRAADKATLNQLLQDYPGHEFLESLSNYRQAYTTWSRYIRAIPAFVEPDGRLRCSWHFDRSETGRLSTTKPPLHQIPRDSDIRSVFAAPPGYKLVQADYEQVEIRMAAHIAGDPKLTALLLQLEKEGTDFHTKMASEAFRIPLEQVTPTQRQSAKEVSFGLLYLMGDKKLASGTGLPGKEAVAFVKRYKDLMPGVWECVADIRRQMKENGYVESIFGRRRRFYLLTADNLDDLHREAVNMPIQSSASDLTLWKVIELESFFKESMISARVVLMVHDSIVVETLDELAEEVADIMRQIMTKPPFKTNVPFPVEVKIGQAWGEGAKVKKGD